MISFVTLIPSPGRRYAGQGALNVTGGKVGVNTDNTLPDYALAVNGGVIATRVRCGEKTQKGNVVISN